MRETSDIKRRETSIEEVARKEKNLFWVTLNDEYLSKAFNFAREKHQGQSRASGEEYIFHPFEVAKIIFEEWGIHDKELIAAAYLHDIYEDTDVDLQTIKEEFGENVANYVDAVSKLRSEDVGEGKDAKTETLKKVTGSAFNDPRVAVLKSADRLHNMRTIDSLSDEDKKERTAKETLNVYVPLDESLGMWEVKKALENLSFPHAYPQEYKKIQTVIDGDPRWNDEFIKNKEEELISLLEKSPFKGRVDVKKNSYWAIYQKMNKALETGKIHNIHLPKINDIVSFRVILEEEEFKCGDMLLRVKDHYKNNENILIEKEREDDFITYPTPNNYQALQITLDLGDGGGCIEIAIATEEMEQFNKKGILYLMQKGVTDLSEYSRKPIFIDKDRVMFLHPSATFIDLAYAIHPNNAKNLSGAQVEEEIYEPKDIVPPSSSPLLSYVHEDRSAPPSGFEEFATLSETLRYINKQREIHEENELVINGRNIFHDHLSSQTGLGFLTLEGLRLNYKMSLEEIKDHYRQASINPNYPERFINQLKSRVSTEQLGLSTVEVKVPDEAGMAYKLIGLISSVNINISIFETERLEDGRFLIRLVLDDPEKKLNKDCIAAGLANDERYTDLIVV